MKLSIKIITKMELPDKFNENEKSGIKLEKNNDDVIYGSLSAQTLNAEFLMMILNFITFVGETSFGELMTIIFFSESVLHKKTRA